MEEFPRTDGSTACIPLIAQIMADTTGIDLETAQGCVNTNKTSWAWRNLGLYSDGDDGTRLILAYEPSESVKEELAADGRPLEQKAIGRMHWYSSSTRTTRPEPDPAATKRHLCRADHQLEGGRRCRS